MREGVELVKLSGTNIVIKGIDFPLSTFRRNMSYNKSDKYLEIKFDKDSKGEEGVWEIAFSESEYRDLLSFLRQNKL